MPTDPLTGSRYPQGSDVPNVAQYIQNAVVDLSDNTIPRFSTTTARDNAYTAWVALGNTMADGMQCVVNGVPYRRIGGTWRINRERIIWRAADYTSSPRTISAGGANQTGLSGVPALSSFTLYEASRVKIDAMFRVGFASDNAGAATCSVVLNGSNMWPSAVHRQTDGTVFTVGGSDLAAGTHSIAARVDVSGATATWYLANITIVVGVAE